MIGAEGGDVVPFEINCRYSGTSSTRAQLGFPDVAYGVQKYVLGEEPPAFLPGERGSAFAYFWTSSTRGAIRTIPDRAGERPLSSGRRILCALFDVADTLLHKPSLYHVIQATLASADIEVRIDEIVRAHRLAREGLTAPDETGVISSRPLICGFSEP